MSETPLEEWSRLYIPIDDTVFNKAYELALAFSRHCKENNLPTGFIINNVTCNASEIKEKAYVDGKKYEKERIATLLGLNNY